MAVSITGVSGTIGHGESITIAGSGFGTKSPAAPSFWDNLEDGATDVNANIGTWEADANRILVINTTNQRHANSAYNAMANFDGSHDMDNAKFQGGTNTTKWFVQYWFKLDNNFAWGGELEVNLGNVKFFRMWSTGSEANNFVCAFHGGDAAGAITEVCDEDYPGYFEFSPADITKNVWHCFQFEFNSSTVNNRDGTFKMYYDGDLVESWSIKTKCTAESGDFRPQVIGFFNSTDADASGSKQVYFDDFYADPTWARVEIGNANTYLGCTHREIQIPSSWAAEGDEVAVTVNRGSFGPTDTAYLYVVDSDGTVNASGYEIAFGDEETTTSTTSTTSSTTSTTSTETTTTETTSTTSTETTTTETTSTTSTETTTTETTSTTSTETTTTETTSTTSTETTTTETTSTTSSTTSSTTTTTTAFGSPYVWLWVRTG